MRYITFIRMVEDLGDPPPGLVEAMSRELTAAFADGTMLEAGGLSGMRDSTEIRLDSGAVTQVDGPYAEGKEVVGGYVISEVRSHDEAVASARRLVDLHLEHWPGWDGAVEIRQMFSAFS